MKLDSVVTRIKPYFCTQVAIRARHSLKLMSELGISGHSLCMTQELMTAILSFQIHIQLCLLHSPHIIASASGSTRPEYQLKPFNFIIPREQKRDIRKQRNIKLIGPTYFQYSLYYFPTHAQSQFHKSNYTCTCIGRLRLYKLKTER